MKKIVQQYQIKLIILFLVVFVVGCFGPIKDLKKMKEWHGNGEYAEIAEFEIDCKSKKDVCSQMHLIKGDSCYRLAKDMIDMKDHYNCAIKHLEQGMQQTEKWKSGDLDLKKDQTYENLCESIRNRQDMESGETARQYTNKLLEISTQFKKEYPENLAAIYFYNVARFTIALQKMVQYEENLEACNELNDIIKALDKALPEATNTKYADNYRQLRSDVTSVRNNTPACQ